MNQGATFDAKDAGPNAIGHASNASIEYQQARSARKQTETRGTSCGAFEHRLQTLNQNATTMMLNYSPH